MYQAVREIKTMTDPNFTDAQIKDVWAYAVANNLVDGDDFNIDGNNFLAFVQNGHRMIFVNVCFPYVIAD
jgi:hypothetical protein